MKGAAWWLWLAALCLRAETLTLVGETAGPTGTIAVDAGGELYFSTGTEIHRLRADGQAERIAGGGKNLGEGAAALDAAIEPRAIGLGPGGAVVFAEQARVRRLQNGVITTIAGINLEGFAGDGGPALGAQVNQPRQ
jgi:hypothetical protein